MKKISSFLVRVCAVLVLSSCGGGSSNGFKLPKTIDGRLGEFYTVKSAEILPDSAKNDGQHFYFTVEIEKNDKEFDFSTRGLHHNIDVIDESRLATGEWAIMAVVYNADGKIIDDSDLDYSDWLLEDCSQPGQSEKGEMHIILDDEDVDGEKTIVLYGIANVEKK